MTEPRDPTPAPSVFWQGLSEEHSRQLSEHGFESIKRRQALRYFTWRWKWSATFRSEQLRYLLSHRHPGEWVHAWRSNDLSGDEWGDLEWSKLERHFYCFAVRLLWAYAEDHGDREVLDLPEPLTGGPIPVHEAGRLISQDLANSSIEVEAMRRALDGQPPRSILEVGAGYGRTAYSLLGIFPDATYTIIDIEPAISISRWYLTQLFDEDRLRFLAPTEVDQIDDHSVDLAVSISSLQEMTADQVAKYLQLFDRVACGGAVFLKQWKSWRNDQDDVTMRFEEYPIPRRWLPRFVERAPVQTRFVQAAYVVPS